LRRARTGSQFLYRLHRLSDNRELDPKPGDSLGRIAGFLTSKELMDFIGKVTDEDAVLWSSAHPMLDMPIDFLALHDGNIAAQDRRIAHVLQRTPNWRPDWGGALQFLDRSDPIEEADRPAFDARNLFGVTKVHSVAQVAPFGGLRSSVSGWFHAAKSSGMVRLLHHQRFGASCLAFCRGSFAQSLPCPSPQ
jgi:SM-20-related protein